MYIVQVSFESVPRYSRFGLNVNKLKLCGNCAIVKFCSMTLILGCKPHICMAQQN